jgi:NitT/TauT family transport system permease protein
MTGYAMPRIALAPFFVMWFGIGLQSKVLLVVSVVFFVVLFNVRQGLETVDPDHLDVMRSMRAGRFSTMRYVLIPTVVPWLVAGIKIAVGQALVSAVVAEMVGSTKGLGWFVVDSLNRFDMSGALTALVILVLLARGLYYILALVESQLFRWRKESGTVDVP